MGDTIFSLCPPVYSSGGRVSFVCKNVIYVRNQGSLALRL